MAGTTVYYYYYGIYCPAVACRVGKGFQPAPASIDWRTSGAVGVVKDQSVCGSCWTFSASQAMSAAWWLATGDFVSLAEQQMMDCAWEYVPLPSTNC